MFRAPADKKVPAASTAAKKTVPESLLKKAKINDLVKKANAIRRAHLRKVCIDSF